MFRTPAAESEKTEKATFQGYKKKSFPQPARPYSPPPSYHSRERSAKKKTFQPDEAHLKAFESIPRPKPKPTPRYTGQIYTYSPTSTPRRKPPFKVPRRLVTGVKDWYK